jgi:protease I
VAKCALDATTVGAEYVDEACVVDGTLVCGRTWHDNTPMMKAFMGLLNDQNPDR